MKADRIGKHSLSRSAPPRGAAANAVKLCVITRGEPQGWENELTAPDARESKPPERKVSSGE